MKLTSQLGLFLALALMITGCGSQSESSKQQEGNLPEQVVVQLPEQEQPEKEAEQKDQEQQQAEDTKPNEQAGAAAGNNTPPAKSDKPDASKGSNASKPANGGSTAPQQPTPGKKQPAGNLQMLVTHNFGAASEFNRSVSYYGGESVMDVMRQHLEIETAYGGSFVNSINGVKSGYTDKSIFTRKKRDWFYYVNGVVSSVGADAYAAKNSASVWWDYHDWSGSGSNTPAVVASYPHPFTSGYEGARPGTVIYYSDGHADDADRLASALRGQGAQGVSTASYRNQTLIENTTNVILLGLWSELEDHSSVQDVMSSPTRTGIYAKVKDGAVQMLDYTGDESGKAGQAMVVATGTGNGDTTPTWLLIGVNDAALDEAVNTMTSGGSKLRGKVGIVLSGSTAVGIPVAP